MPVLTQLDPGAAVKGYCETEWDRWKSDCSGFVKAVAKDAGITLTGQANAIIDTIGKAPWQQLGNDGKKASQLAAQGKLVIAGLKATPNGHVAVIVEGGGSIPVGYWGRLGGIGRKNTSINYSWRHDQLTQVQYFSMNASK